MPQQRYSLDSDFEKRLNYSRVLVDDEWVFVSGCSGFNYKDMTISDSMVEQTEQTFRNIEWCLKQADVTFDDVVRIRIIVADKKTYPEAADVIGRYCEKSKPANTTWFAELPDPRIKIEIEVTAKKHVFPSCSHAAQAPALRVVSLSERSERVVEWIITKERRVWPQNGRKNCRRMNRSYLKEATINDCDTLVTIIRDSFRDVAVRFSLTMDNCPKHPSHCTSSWIESDISRGVQYFILYSDSTPVGCVGVECPNDDLCYLERLAVLPDMRGKHFGADLVKHALGYAALNGSTTVSIGIISESTELKEWYKKLGFMETHTRRFPHLPFDVCFLEYEITKIKEENRGLPKV